jgi:hypothetical protein
MTLAAFYDQIATISPTKQRYKDAQAAQRLGDLLLRGVAAPTAIANVESRRDLKDALTLSGQLTAFESITGP